MRLYGRQAIAHGDPTHGWDRQRELTFARQKELGVIPADAELTERHAEIPAWDDMAEELKPVLERQMEIYAGFLSHADHHVGRLLDAIEQLGVLDDTLIYVIVGDNGASAEGTLQGSFNEMINFNAMAALETPAFMAERLDKFGGPESYNHYAVGWAWAMDRRWRGGTLLHIDSRLEQWTLIVRPASAVVQRCRSGQRRHHRAKLARPDAVIVVW